MCPSCAAILESEVFGPFVKPDYQALIQARQALVQEMSNGGAKGEKVQQNVPDDATAAEISSGIFLTDSHLGRTFESRQSFSNEPSDVRVSISKIVQLG